MGDANDILMNDRSLVQLGGHVMTRGTDELHPALVRLMVGLCADKCREEGVMDIENLVGKSVNETRRHDLHVTGQYDGVDAVLLHQRDVLRLHFSLGFRCHRRVNERDVKALRSGAKMLVIANDQRDIAGQLASFVPGEQIVEAVPLFRDEQSYPTTLLRDMQRPLHLSLVGDRREGTPDVFRVHQRKTIQRPLHAHEEHVRLAVHMLVQVQDVPAVIQDVAGDGIDEAGLIRAVYEQGDGGHAGRELWHASFA